MRLLVVFAAVMAFGLAEAKLPLALQYKGYKVLRAVPTDMLQVQLLDKLNQRESKYDFWTTPRGISKPVDIMAKPSDVEDLASFLKNIKVNFEVLIDDVNTKIQEQMVRANVPYDVTPRKPGGPRLTFDAYHTYEEIQQFLLDTASSYPNIASKGSIGSSYEGRDLGYIKIGSPGLNKPAIWIDGGIHAREWISPATVTYIIDQLTRLYGSDNTVTSIVDGIDWYIIPSLNPDGYAFSWSDDRLWRKSRSPNAGSACLGTDPNRNYGFHWNEGGSSDQPCSDTYHGPSAFSDVESQAARDFLLSSTASNVQVYLTFHSYGQYWLTPWGYTSDYPIDYPDLYALAVNAVNALTAVYGTQYTIGTSTNTLYIASGGSDDWAKGGAGIDYSYTVELRDTGNNGFTLPPREILPTGIETFEAIKVVGTETLNGLP